MKKLLLVALQCLFISSCSTTNNTTSDPTNNTLGLIFGVSTDSYGQVIGVRLVDAKDTKTKTSVPFNPSPELMQSARSQISRYRWFVRRDSDGVVQESFMPCWYMPSNPNRVTCDFLDVSKAASEANALKPK